MFGNIDCACLLLIQLSREICARMVRNMCENGYEKRKKVVAGI